MALKDQLKLIWDVFSVRNSSQQRASSFKPDVLSEKLRTGIVMLYVDVISGRMPPSQGWSTQDDYTAEFWKEMHQSLRHLYRRPVLSSHPSQSEAEDAFRFVNSCGTSEFFDFIELSFKTHIGWRVFRDENDFVGALNAIFRIENSPYQVTPGVVRTEPNPVIEGRFSGGMIVTRVAFPKVVRMDDEVPHTEAVLPALSILSHPDYSGANDEFRKALEDYRKGDFEDCLVKCGSSFESTLKVLCRMNRVAFDPNKDAAGALLDKLLPNSQLDSGTFKEPLIAIGRMRNRLSSAHGGGSKVKAVPRHVAQYAVTNTAAAIVLLVHDMGK